MPAASLIALIDPCASAAFTIISFAEPPNSATSEATNVPWPFESVTLRPPVWTSNVCGRPAANTGELRSAPVSTTATRMRAALARTLAGTRSSAVEETDQSAAPTGLESLAPATNRSVPEGPRAAAHAATKARPATAAAVAAVATRMPLEQFRTTNGYDNSPRDRDQSPTASDPSARPTSRTPYPSSSFRVPSPDAVRSSSRTTWGALSPGSAAQTRAAAAATRGAAKDVPSGPGAAIDTQGPVFEKSACEPSASTDATARPSRPRSAAGYSGRLA